MAVSHSKRNTSRSDNGIAVYDLGTGLAGNQIIDLKYNSIYDGRNSSRREIIELITKAIHGIPSLFEKVELDHVQIYLGKTAEHRITNRPEEHWLDRDIPYFLPLIKINNREIDYIEKLGLKYLFFLKNNNHLCFGKLLNEKEGGGGRRTETKTQIIYLAFRVDKRCKSTPIKKEDIDNATGYLYYSLNTEFPKDADAKNIKDILNSIYKTNRGIKLYWDEDSRK